MESDANAHNRYTHFSFVILHYLDDKETSRCIRSILDIAKADSKHTYSLIVVDNHSNNGSTERLKQQFLNNNSITFIDNPENMGFSRGNNIGYQYALDHCTPDFVVVLNNDTFIEQHNFAQCCENSFVQNSPYIIGPDIFFTSTKTHKNPDSLVPTNAQAIIGYMNAIDHPSRKHRLRLLIEKIPFVKDKIDSHTLAQDRAKHANWDQPAINPQFQGSVLIFTPLFVSTKELPFIPETFLYYEEIILAERCRKNHWKTYYDPNIHVFHESAASTRMSLGSSDIQTFRTIQQRKAMDIALRYFQSE